MDNKGSVKVRLLEKSGDIDSMQESLNDALSELEDYFIVDIKAIAGFVGIMYFSKKKREQE